MDGWIAGTTLSIAPRLMNVSGDPSLSGQLVYFLTKSDNVIGTEAGMKKIKKSIRHFSFLENSRNILPKTVNHDFFWENPQKF